jgi:uncharacterized membrane protein YhaH (DUF805 family)
MRPEETMDWKHLFLSFEGRISRKPFWLSLLALIIIEWILIIVLSLVFGMSMMGGMDPGMDPEAVTSAAMTAMIPMWILLFLFFYPALAIYTKRWHDHGTDGVWSFIMFIPIIGAIWLIVECGFLRGTEGPNLYGDDPLA